MVTLCFKVQFSILTINYDFYLYKLLVCCLLIVSKVAVTFKFGVEIKGFKI